MPVALRSRYHEVLLTCTVLLAGLMQRGLAAQPEETTYRSDVRILFLGDSITAAAHYVNDIETALFLQAEEAVAPEIVSLGLSSETASGLSEKTHPFPRPTIHERLDRVLAATQPDIVVACYGINDGIYQPFSNERFAAYRNGIREFIEKTRDIGARIVLLTPPPYARKELASVEPREESEFDYRVPFPDYDSVMARYAEWLMTLDKLDNVRTIDIRTPMLSAVAESYGTDPIHPNAHGHRVMATAVLGEWNKVVPESEAIELSNLTEDERWTGLHKLVSQRRKIHDGKLLWEIGHNRPGDAPEITMEEARSMAVVIERRIASLIQSTGGSRE